MGCVFCVFLHMDLSGVFRILQEVWPIHGIACDHICDGLMVFIKPLLECLRHSCAKMAMAVSGESKEHRSNNHQTNLPQQIIMLTPWTATTSLSNLLNRRNLTYFSFLQPQCPSTKQKVNAHARPRNTHTQGRKRYPRMPLGPKNMPNFWDRKNQPQKTTGQTNYRAASRQIFK